MKGQEERATDPPAGEADREGCLEERAADAACGPPAAARDGPKRRRPLQAHANEGRGLGEGTRGSLGGGMHVYTITYTGRVGLVVRG